MGTKRILVDATHQEQTRVALLDGSTIEDFEVEVTSKKPLKSNIYLARISRIEPSLQAAFVEYGGNRHGFLPFSEIHPDYFLISDEERNEIEEYYRKRRNKNKSDDLESTPTSVREDDLDEDEIDLSEGDEEEKRKEPQSSTANQLPPHRRYNIQDVLKRRQILLIQVAKEERGNKGAAISTYLSIAGRYCVLMPNTHHVGGVSRRIASVSDRRRLRNIVKNLNTPDGMAVIVRTAGSQKSRLDIQRDYEYLLRVWSSIRNKALNSYTPSLLFEEADLIKRTIRDMYSREINEILITGQAGYETAREFMSLLIPNRVNKLRPYNDKRIPLFERWNTEDQIEKLVHAEVPLPSGGSLVINPTEALVAIDVNSGRSTSEGSVEDTAVATNIEAATEVARQLRLRNLAGLVVIDFIDMEVGRHRTMVERRLREALSIDRSRVQVGHISPFGLLELSRQRTSPSLIEAVASPCNHCAGNGIKWSVEAAGLQVIRGIEAELMKSLSTMLVYAHESAAFWILNEKRDWITDTEKQHDIRISIISDNSLSGAQFKIDRIQSSKVKNDDSASQPIASGDYAHAIEASEDDSNAVKEEEKTPLKNDDNREGKRRRRRRNNRRTNTETAKQARSIPIEETKEAPTQKAAPTRNAKERPSEPKVAQPSPPKEDNKVSSKVSSKAEDKKEDTAPSKEVSEKKPRAKRVTKAKTNTSQTSHSEKKETVKKEQVNAKAKTEVKQEAVVPKNKKSGWWQR